MRVASLSATLLAFLHAASALSPRLRALRESAEKTNKRRRLFANGPFQMINFHVCQTYYVPLPEKELNADTFRQIFHNAGGDPDENQKIISIVSLSISRDDTIVYYDHYEDGYEENLSFIVDDTTEVWGDGNATNGCAPTDPPTQCTDENDILVSGRSIVLENDVFPYRTEVKYGGRDKISATLPVTVTRGAYPDYPGSVLAGAVEVMDTSWWGKEYHTAISTETEGQMDFNFEYVGAYVQACEDDTTVTYPDGSTEVLNEGEIGYAVVDENGVAFGADKKVQVHMLTGDKNSIYELRWYALFPREKYFTEYYSPVGDKGDNGGIQIVCYNPHDENLVVSYEVLKNGNWKEPITRTITCPAKGNCWSLDIPRGSGGRYFASKEFLAFAVIDTGSDLHDGSVSDWGFPLIPSAYLTPQVLIGWGYGCGGLDCEGGSSKAAGASRSVVWVTVMEDASVFVDYDNDGAVDAKKGKARRLTSFTFKHDSDHDMSGAVIWGTKWKSGENGPPALIACAWGQDPDLSDHTDRTQALDMGTVVMPLTGLDVYKSVELVSDNPIDIGTEFEDMMSQGDTIRYIIHVINVGQLDFAAQDVVVKDVLSDYVQYIPGTTFFRDWDGNVVAPIDDGVAPDPVFPLTNGVGNMDAVVKRGGGFQISFEVIIDIPEDATIPLICNDGTADGPFVTFDFNLCFLLPPDDRSEFLSDNPTSQPTDMPTISITDEPSAVPDEDEECPEDEVLLFL